VRLTGGRLGWPFSILTSGRQHPGSSLRHVGAHPASPDMARRDLHHEPLQLHVAGGEKHGWRRLERAPASIAQRFGWLFGRAFQNATDHR